MLKLFAPYIPHITDEIYSKYYKQFEKDASIHISPWPEPVLIDKEMENAGEIIKDYISQVRSWKSEQGIALNSPIKASATYASKNVISKLKASESIIKTTLKYPDNHGFIVGKPDIQEKITQVTPVYSKLGPLFKNESKKINQWIDSNQDTIIKKIEKDGEIFFSNIPDASTDIKEGLVKGGYLTVKKETRVKGKKDSKILPFDSFYLELVGN